MHSAAFARPAPVGARSTRLLIVDDDPLMCEAAKMFFRLYGHEIQAAPDGRAGLSILERESFDAAIFDIGMPGLSGLELLAAVRRMPAHARLPIIVCTSRDDAAAIGRAFELGATSFIIKPVNWTLVDYQIRFIMRGAEQIAEINARLREAEQALSARGELLAFTRQHLGALDAAGAPASAGMNTALGDIALYDDLLRDRVPVRSERLSAATVLETARHAVARACGIDTAAVVLRDESDSAMLAIDPALAERALTAMARHLAGGRAELAGLRLSAWTTLEGMIIFAVTTTGSAVVGRGQEPSGTALCLPIARRLAGLLGGRVDPGASDAESAAALLSLPAGG